MGRITSPASPFSFLEQRLQYADLHPERDWSIIVDNVPKWPGPLALELPEPGRVSQYAPARGHAPLLETICARENEKYGTQLNSANVLVTNGGMHALSLIFRQLYRPGARMLCQAPVFGSIARHLRHVGYDVRLFEVRNGLIDFESLEALLESPVAGIYVNSPNNPTGEIIAETQMQALAAFAKSRGLALIIDAVYDEYTFGYQRPALPALIGREHEDVFAVNSLSKNFGAPGLRTGWIISAARNITRLAAMLEEETVAVGGYSQQAALSLINRGAPELQARVLDGLSLITHQLNCHPEFQYSLPAGGTQLLISVPVADSDDFADTVLEELGLVMVTDSHYEGLHGSSIRFPLGLSLSELAAAFNLLVRGLESYRHSAAAEPPRRTAVYTGGVSSMEILNVVNA